MSTYRGLTPVKHSVLIVLNVIALVGALNQVKAQVGAFSVIVKTSPKVRLHLYSPNLVGADESGTL